MDSINYLGGKEFNDTLTVAIALGFYLYEKKDQLKTKNEKLFIAEALVECSENLGIELNSDQCVRLFKVSLDNTKHLKELINL